MYSIRRADLGDLDTIARLRMDFLRESGNLADDADAPALEEAVRRYLSDKMPTGEFVAWLAEEDGEVVGTGGVSFVERPPRNGNLSGREAYVMNMYTVPRCRGRGIATAILREILDFAKGSGLKRLRLTATPAGRPVYEKIGFTPESSEMTLTL